MSAIHYNPGNWYWIVGDSTTQVYSSSRAEYVSVNDTIYLSWLSLGYEPTKIATEASLIEVLQSQYPAGWPQTLAQQAQAALRETLTITSTATVSISGSYNIDDTVQAHLGAEINSLLLNDKFADGELTVSWPDVTGTVHTFTVDDFKAFATAIGAYVASLYKVMNGVLTTLPPSSVTIP